jgi:hypothetical protein
MLGLSHWVQSIRVTNRVKPKYRPRNSSAALVQPPTYLEEGPTASSSINSNPLSIIRGLESRGPQHSDMRQVQWRRVDSYAPGQQSREVLYIPVGQHAIISHKLMRRSDVYITRMKRYPRRPTWGRQMEITVAMTVYSGVSQPGFRRTSSGVPREIVE